MVWLDGTPIAVLKAHAAMLPRLSAEESLQAADQVALGTGSLKKDAHRRMTNRLQRAARGGRRQPRRKASPAALAAMGVGVEIVKVPHG